MIALCLSSRFLKYEISRLTFIKIEKNYFHPDSVFTKICPYFLTLLQLKRILYVYLCKKNRTADYTFHAITMLKMS